MNRNKQFKAKLISLNVCVAILLLSWNITSYAAVVANDGGITLWVSYDNLDVADASLDDTITEANVLPDGFSCTATNNGRSAVSQPNSPPSCPGGTGSCTGLEKVSGDIDKLADYIFASSEGAHYLRRVYISDQGRAWESADIKWNTGVGGSSAPGNGWANSDRQMNLNSGYRTCIHDVVHHELGHYVYNLPDRYFNDDGYYQGTISGGTPFQVDVTGRDINTVMSNNFPHLFVDTTNAQLTVDYNQPGPGSTTGEVLTPGLLADADPANDGPDRAHHTHTMPFAQDEWSIMPSRHVDLTGVHTEGSFPDPGARPAVDIVVIGDDEPHPGTVLLLDRSGSMGVTTNGVTAAQFVQEAGMFLYHSSEPTDIVGTYLYNASVEELFPYDEYDSSNDLAFVSFRNASGATDIAEALETAIDALIAEHGEGGVSGGEIYLMSDGRQTTGDSLWDQVDRANTRGIKINTFSFGDADTGTMDSIASGTSGSNTPMSERGDAEELKLIMAREFSTGRGLTPVFSFKGRMRNKINVGATQLYAGSFSVPPKSRRVQFYTFINDGDASQSFNVKLESPSGQVFVSPAPDNTAKKGRFNGVKVNKAEPGTWSFVISGIPGSGLPNKEVELVAYADNRELKGNVWIGSATQEYKIPLHAKLDFRYPLTDMRVTAHIYEAGRLVTSVPMFDDGKSGLDVQNKDGIYSAHIDFKPQEWDKLRRDTKTGTDKLRVEVEFDVTEKSGPARNAHYETGFTKEMLSKDFARGNRSSFKAWATGVINLRDFKPHTPKRPRLICALSDQIKAKLGDSGQIKFTLENARPLASQLRVSLGQGIKVKVEQVSRQKDEKDAKAYKKNKRSTITPSPSQTLSNTYIAHYEVDEAAKPGARALQVQFGDVILRERQVLEVTK